MTTLFNKEGFTFTKMERNYYKLLFKIENPNIILSKIIDFNLVKLIYDLNPDIYEKTNLNIIDENEAIIQLLMKHLFEDLGFPQKYSHLHITKEESETCVRFTSVPIKEKPEGIPNDAESMQLKSLICFCDILTPHKVLFSCDVRFDDNANIPPIGDKIIGLILYKIFTRMKQFIENVKM